MTGKGSLRSVGNRQKQQQLFGVSMGRRSHQKVLRVLGPGRTLSFVDYGQVREARRACGPERLTHRGGMRYQLMNQSPIYRLSLKAELTNGQSLVNTR